MLVWASFYMMRSLEKHAAHKDFVKITLELRKNTISNLLRMTKRFQFKTSKKKFFFNF